MKIIIITSLITIYFGVIYFARNREKRLWNKGYCPDCNQEWESFDVDSQGGRGYHCECSTIWISYNVDK